MIVDYIMRELYLVKMVDSRLPIDRGWAWVITLGKYIFS